MDDKQGSDSFDEEMNRNMQVGDELPAVESSHSFSEITESGQGLIDLPQSGVSFSSEDTRSGEFEPTQQSKIIGQSENVSERRDMVSDSSLEGQLSVETKSSEQSSAIPETLQAATVRESKCPVASDPPSENIETDYGVRAAPQSGIAPPSEGIKPSQLAGIPSYPSKLSREKLSARKEMLDFGSPGPSSIVTISAKPKGAIPKSGKITIAGESKITKPQKIESMNRDMGKLKIDDSTGNKLPGEHPSTSKQSNSSSCKEENKNASQVGAMEGLDFFNSYVKWLSESENSATDPCTLHAISLIKSSSKCIGEATKLDMTIKIKILKTFLKDVTGWYDDRVRHLLRVTIDISRYSEKQAESMKEYNTLFMSLLKETKQKLSQCCDCCISDKVEIFLEFMGSTEQLMSAITVAEQSLNAYSGMKTLSRGQAIVRDTIATYASHQQQPNSPLRLTRPTAEASSASGEDPRVPVVECFSQDDTSPEVTPSKDNEQSGRSRVREGGAKDGKRNRKGWRKK